MYVEYSIQMNGLNQNTMEKKNTHTQIDEFSLIEL